MPSCRARASRSTARRCPNPNRAECNSVAGSRNRCTLAAWLGHKSLSKRASSTISGRLRTRSPAHPFAGELKGSLRASVAAAHERPVAGMTPMNLQNDPRAGPSPNSASASRCCAARTRCWCAAKAASPTTSSLARQAYAVIVRSRHAHGIIRGIDTDAARKMPGVLGVYTGADLVAPATARSSASCRSRTATAAR